MNATSDYRDLLWDFACERLAEKREVTLRTYTSEDQMYETKGQPTQTYPVMLPTEWFGPLGAPRDVWTPPFLSPDRLMVLGRQLWGSIPDPAQHPLHEATPDQPCRLKISSNSPTIDDLPWEWLNDGMAPPFALRPEIRLARSVPIRMVIPPMTVEGPVRVLLVLPNPSDELLLNTAVEIAAVRPRLDAAPYDLTILEQPTWRAWVKALHEEPHIVHYIGHAGLNRGEGSLILHDPNNLTRWISAAEFTRILPLSVRLLCLSTCFTAPNYQILGLPRLAHSPGRCRLPTTITNRYPVREHSVRTFWEAFYESLAAGGGNVNEAFHQAQQAVAAAAVAAADWGGFSLVIRDQSGEGIRLEGGGMKPPSLRAAEIQAQLASCLANKLADRLLTLGQGRDSALLTQFHDVMQKRFSEEAAKASDLARDLRKRTNG